MHESVKLLEERCFASPDIIRGLDVKTFQHVATLLETGAVVFTTGIGASEGPARLLASCLSSPHRVVHFIPLSGLLAGDHRAWIKDCNNSRLVVFSQALSPNAQMALEAGKEFVTTVLVCGPDVRVESPKPLAVIRHPPTGESGFLVRVTGPAVASAIALALALMVTRQLSYDEVQSQLQQCAEAMEKRLQAPAPEVDFIWQPPAFLVCGKDGVEQNHLLRWTLLECLDKHDPSLWDLLSFAHGAFQNIFDTSRTLILPRSTVDVAMEPLVERLRDMLRQTQHTLLDMPSDLARPWCVLEHIAMVQALVLGHLRKYPRDLGNWPGRGCDGALYTLDTLPVGT
jgi:hypothetical protein